MKTQKPVHPKKAKSGVPEPGTNGHRSYLPWAIFVSGITLMFMGSINDLWLDEIISFQWAKSAASPWEIFSLYRHDNNHPLNTLWIYLVGEGKPSWVYRLLSVGSGAGSLLLLWGIGRQLCPRTAWVPLFLGATSFPLLLYFSEARGYAMAVAGVLGCFWILIQPGREISWVRVFLFNLFASAAILSHASSIFVLIAMGGWHVLCAVLDFRTGKRTIWKTGLYFLWPALLSLTFYFYFLKQMEVAGGPSYSPALVFAQFYGYAMGLPVSGPAIYLTLLLAFGLIVLGVFWSDSALPNARWLFGILLVGAPALGLLFSRSEFLYFRYFLVVLPFIYVLLGLLAQKLTTIRKIPGSLIVYGCVVLFLAGQSPRLIEWFRMGRGHYEDALNFIASKSEGRTLVQSDHDFRTGLVFLHHLNQSEHRGRITYMPSWENSNTSPDWYITHNQDPFPQKIPQTVDHGDLRFDLQGVFSSGPVSGFHWFLYSKSNSPAQHISNPKP